MKPVEQLYTCPACARTGFLLSGLTKHCCPARNGERLSAPQIHTAKKAAHAAAPDSPMSKDKTNSPKPKGALVVLDQPHSLAKPTLKKFQVATLAAIEQIAITDRRNVELRVKVGFALCLVKEGIGHKNFTPWLKENLKAMGYTQCTYMMRLARELAASADFSADDLLALANGKNALQLAPKKNVSAKIDAAVKDFVGELSWTELLEKYKITDAKKLGGARTAGATGGAASPDPEQLYLQSRDEASGAIERAETLFLKDNILQHLAGHPEEIRGVVDALRSLATKVESAVAPLLKK